MPLFFRTAVSVACRSNRGQADLLCLTRWDGLLVFVLPHNSFITGLFCLGKISLALDNCIILPRKPRIFHQRWIKAPLKGGYVFLDSTKSGSLLYRQFTNTWKNTRETPGTHIGFSKSRGPHKPFPLWVVTSSWKWTNWGNFPKK